MPSASRLSAHPSPITVGSTAGGGNERAGRSQAGITLEPLAPRTGARGNSLPRLRRPPPAVLAHERAPAAPVRSSFEPVEEPPTPDYLEAAAWAQLKPEGRSRFLFQILQGRRPPTAKEKHRLLDAIKLRRLAEDHYDKNEWEKLVPSLVARLRTRSALFKDLSTRDFEAVRAHLVERPGDGGRTLLKWLARHAYLEGLGVDPRSFMSGEMRRSFLLSGLALEQLHTTLGRVFTAGFMGAAVGAGMTPGFQDQARTAVQTLASLLPTFLIVPAVTGAGRTVTDVIQQMGLAHGFPALPEALATAPDLSAAALREARLEVSRRRGELRRSLQAHPDNTSARHAQPLRALVEAVQAMYAQANDGYKLSMGSYKASAAGKAAGTVTTALGSGVTLASYLQQYDAALYLALGMVAVQPLSGMYDKNLMATYHVDAALKWEWRSLLREASRHKPVDQLGVDDLDEAAVPRRWETPVEIRLKAVRDGYRHELAELTAKFERTADRLARARGLPGAPSKRDEGLEADFREQCRVLEGWRADISHFESLAPARWREIAPDRLGRLTDEAVTRGGKLTAKQVEARLRKPGELLSQINQRYKQLLQDGPASFASTYVVAKLLEAFGMPIVGEVLLAFGAFNWSANTSQTRADKAKEKAGLAAPPGSADEIARDQRQARVPAALEALWDEIVRSNDGPEAALQRVCEAGRWAAETGAGRQQTLTGEHGYRQVRPAFVQHARQLGDAWKRSLFSAPRAAQRLVSTRSERQACLDEFDRVIDTLQHSGFASTPDGFPVKSDALAGRRSRFEEFDVVRQLLPGRGSGVEDDGPQSQQQGG